MMGEIERRIFAVSDNDGALNYEKDPGWWRFLRVMGFSDTDG